MTDPSKSQRSWTFPSTSMAGSTSNLFGQTSIDTSKAPASNIFGATSNAPGTSAPSLFGGGSTTNQGSSLFGGGTASGASNNNQSSSFFGGGNTGGGNTLGVTSPAGGASFSFAQNQSGQPPNSPATGLGGASNTGGSSLFGNVGSSTSTSAPFGATTPTSKAPGNIPLFGNPSTTPAGPPPTNPLSFGAHNPQGQTGNIFSQGQPKSTAQDDASTAAPSGLFGGASQASRGIFQNSQPADKISTSQPAMSVLSGATSNNTSSNIFANKPTTQPTGGLFNNLPSSSAADSSATPAPSDAQQPKAEAPKPMFGTLGGQSAASSSNAQSGGLSMFPSTTQASDAPKSSLNFFPPSTSKPADSGTTSTSGPSLFAASNAVSGVSAPPASVSTSNMFADLGKPAGKSKDATASTAASSAPSLAAAAPLSSGFGDAKPTVSKMQPPATKTTDPASSISVNANLGASTSGPAPTPHSRLKNKSMDEIITRWASDLSKYQKEFQRQAEKVAEWDRMLVENSDKIQKLYGSTLEAQRATAEVERQITVVENEQDELETYLENYEAQVEEMWKAQGGGSDALRGPDKERQETYELAEKLTERLDDMGKDLTSIIEEINDASSSLNKNNKPDDPLSQVVRVLNSHLTQLQQIDQGAAALQLKVAAAQKANQGLGASNGYNGPSSDAADGFYRSYMGRR